MNPSSTFASTAWRVAGVLLFTLTCASPAAAAESERIGEVDTVFKLIGPDHKIVVDAYDDPKVGGVSCYVSRAKTGGIKGAFGLAEDKADASIACRQVGPIRIDKPLDEQEEVFTERISLVFKKLRIVAHGGQDAQRAGLPDVLGPRHRRVAEEQRHGGCGGPLDADSRCAEMSLRRGRRFRPSRPMRRMRRAATRSAQPRSRPRRTGTLAGWHNAAGNAARQTRCGVALRWSRCWPRHRGCSRGACVLRRTPACRRQRARSDRFHHRRVPAS